MAAAAGFGLDSGISSEVKFGDEMGRKVSYNEERIGRGEERSRDGALRLGLFGWGSFLRCLLSWALLVWQERIWPI